MNIDHLPFKDTGYFSYLICDYLDQKSGLKPFYNRFPTLENFQGQIEEKAKNFPDANRKVLSSALKTQYSKTKISKKTQENIEQLKVSNTFTVVTGHQLNLFTGPLYFLYKIVSTINLTKQLKKKYPKYNFVPVYWMATEDHDFDEINHFNFRGKKLRWSREANGAVGKLKTDGLQEVAAVFFNKIGTSHNAETLKRLFENAYLKHETLTEATRFLTNELFGDTGLVIVDGDDANLKRVLIPFVKQDVFEQTSFKEVTNTVENLADVSTEYKIQVNPRAINYFYIKDGIRERIVQNEDQFALAESIKSWSKNELLQEIDDFPERFSPNVIARPLYQEVILPNLCYIGGGGEIAYWLELKAMFEAMKISYPILLLRNSALVIDKKQRNKLKKLDISIKDLFLKQHSFINKKIRSISNIEIDFSSQKKFLEEHFKSLYEMAEQTDASFLGAVKAQEVKQKRGLLNLENRLLKAQKRKLKDHVIRMTKIQNELFPGQSLQERNQNFSELYLELGNELIPILLKSLMPLKQEFTIIEY